jgi:cytochrome c553
MTRSSGVISPPGLPEAAGPYVAAMQLSASRAAADEDLEDIAAFTASMLTTCGDCHRAVGTMPALAPPASSAVGGLVGHMLAHKAAVDLLAQGLTVPSTSAWDEGVRQLRSAPLHRRALPKDAKLTKDIQDNEKRVHSLAERGLEASDTRSKIYVYSELLQSCASCHALHGNVWGPTKR